MSDLQFYHISTSYINYLKQFQRHIWDNEEKGRKRPYIGLVLEIGDYKYYAPMTSPKPKHTKIPESIDLKKIIYQNQLTGVINLNNLIPVQDSDVELVDLNKLSVQDSKYHDLLNNQIIIIRKKHAEIIKDSNLIYKIKTRNYNGYVNLKKRCYDFILLEKKCSEYNK